MNQKELFLISITIFLTIVAWMILDIYKIRTNIEAGFNQPRAINFKLQPQVLEILKRRQP